MCAKNYKNQRALTRVIAKNVGDSFLRQSVQGEIQKLSSVDAYSDVLKCRMTLSNGVLCSYIAIQKALKSTSLLMHVACLLRDLPSHSINDISYTCKFEYFRECEYEQNEKLYYRMQTDCTTSCVSQNLLNCCMQNCMDKLHNKSRTSRSNGDWRQKAAVDRGVINYVLYSTMRRPCDPQARPSTSFVDNTTTSRGEIF